ncbi:MAG: hypothetical protein JXR10_09360 [Cyclobacteriaceae bacterium]
MKQSLFIVFGWLILASSCDPCDDCGEPLSYDPTVQVKFINQDSANALNSLSSALNDSIDSTNSLITYYSDSIKVMQDSLEIIDTLVAAGLSEYIPVQSTFNERILEFETSVIAAQAIRILLDSIDDEYQATLSTINNGSVQLQNVTLLENGAVAVFEDSMTLFSLPLLFENGLTQTTFEITIDGNKYNLSFAYERSESIDEYRRARITAFNLDTVSHTFDSLTVSCATSQCISDETTVTAYF